LWHTIQWVKICMKFLNLYILWVSFFSYFLIQWTLMVNHFFYFFISYAIYYPNLIIFIYSLFSLQQVVIMNVQIILNVKKSVVQLLLNRGVYFVNVNVLKLIYNKSYVIPNKWQTHDFSRQLFQTYHTRVIWESGNWLKDKKVITS
jgi:hypothetical protein